MVARAHDPTHAPYGAPELGALVARYSGSEVGEEEAKALLKAARQTSEQLLWQRHIEQRDAQAREELIMLHLPYARIVAAGLFGKHVHHETTFEEYVQWATVGMIEALDRYDPARGAQFRTYAHTRMLGAIRDGLEHISERQEQLSLHRRLNAERLAAARANKALDETADDAELLANIADIGASMMLSFMLDDTGMIQGAEDNLPDHSYAPLLFKQEQNRLRELIPQLTSREQSVIRLHYLQGFTYDHIAGTLGITRGRVAQLHQQGLERLRKLMAP